MSKKIFVQLSKAIFISSLVILGLLATSSVGKTQVTPSGTGPGGVGTIDGASTLELWVRADDGAFTDAACTVGNEANDGNSVQCWQDKSGNGTDLTVNGSAPIYRTGQFNSVPAIEFSSDVLENTLGDLNSDFSIFIISNSNTTPQSAFTGIFASTDGADTGSFQVDAGGGSVGCSGEYRLNLRDVSDTNIGVCGGTYDSNPTITTALGSSSTAEAYDDSSIQNTSSFGTTPHFEIFGLGRNRGNSLLWDGDIAETIIFFEVLPDVRRILVENYLSAKYDIDISASGNDHYSGDDNANGNYDLNVAGIGQLSGSQNTQAHSVGMIIADNSFLNDDGDWLLFGHRRPDNYNANSLLPTTGDWATAPNPQRWARHWYIDLTDAGSNGGLVDIIFDFSEGSMDECCLPSGPSTNYRLLGRSAASGPFSDIATATSIVADQVLFEGVDVSDLGSSFTLGTLDYSTSPTAVTMQDFTVTSTAMPVLVIGSFLILALVSVGIIFRKKEDEA